MHPTQNQVSPATQPTLADILRRAALYLAGNGWTRGPIDDPTELPTTVLHAISASVEGELNRAALYNGAVSELADQLRRSGLVSDFDWLGWASLSSREILSTWNDQHAESADEVINALIAAADYHDWFLITLDTTIHGDDESTRPEAETFEPQLIAVWGDDDEPAHAQFFTPDGYADWYESNNLYQAYPEPTGFYAATPNVLNDAEDPHVVRLEGR